MMKTWIIFPLTALLSVLSTPTAQDTPVPLCNGHPYFCDLKFDQVTFPGSHSAGSGFNGPLRECNGFVSQDLCIFQNQMLSISGQLDLGIRYLSLDVCILPNNCNDTVYGDLSRSRLVSCQGSETDMSFGGYQYGGRVLDILEQVNEWMRNNTGEVIGIHFTGNMPSADRNQAYTDLVQLLESMWGEGTSNNMSSGYVSATEMNTYYSSNSRSWPTLREAINANQRIFIFFDDVLDVDPSVTPWLNPPPFSTFETVPYNTACIDPGIIDHAPRCNATGNDLVIAVGYTPAVCILNGQTSCNLILRNATDICYGFRSAENRTVNVLLVDFPESGTDPDSVFSVVMELNIRNMRRYLGDVTTAPSPPSNTSDVGDVTTVAIVGTMSSLATSMASSSLNTSHLHIWISFLYCLFYLFNGSFQ